MAVSSLQARLARVSIASGLLFLVLLLALHVLEPEFDPTWRFISEYMLGSVGWIMRLAFLALATSLVSAAAALSGQVRGWPKFIGLGLLGLAAVGLTLAALFTPDPITTSPDAATFSGQMHAMGAALDYTPAAALLLSFGLRRDPAWRPLRTRLFAAAGISLVIMLAFVAALPRDGQFRPGVPAGLVGRFLLLSYLGWLVPVGVQLLKLHAGPAASSVTQPTKLWTTTLSTSRSKGLVR